MDKWIWIGLGLIALLCSFGCSHRPMRIEYYPPRTAKEIHEGKGAIKVIDYKKSDNGFTVLGLSVSLF